MTEQDEKVLMVIRETCYEFINEVVELGEMNIKGVQNEFVRADIGTKDFTATGVSCEKRPRRRRPFAVLSR